MNIQKSVFKKAYKEIKGIKNASNMLQVEACINNALLDVFGVRNMGFIKHAINSGNDNLLSAYGYKGKSRNFELIKAVRYHNLETYGKEAKDFLISFIPERMHKSGMYKRLIN